MLYTLLAVALLVLAAGLLLYLGNLLWSAARLPMGAALERRRFESYVARARRGDRYLREDQVTPAVEQFVASFYPFPARSRSMAQAVINHHTGLLSRLIAAADQWQGERVRLISLAKVDRLLSERDVLQRRYLTLRQSGSRQRLKAFEKELRSNTHDVRAALASLAAEISTLSRPPRYH